MLKDVAFGMKLGRLRAAFHCFNLGDNRTQQPGGVEQIPSSKPMRGKKNPHQLVTNSFRADLHNRRRTCDESLPGLLLNLKIERGGKANRTQKPEPIFGKSLPRMANSPNQFGFQVSTTTNEINHPVAVGIEKHAVDGEIAPLGVFFRR